MPTYSYTARDSDGKKITGSSEAPDSSELQLRLSRRGLYLVASKELSPSLGKKLKNDTIVDFCRQLGALLDAGISAPRSLSRLASEAGIKQKQKIVYEYLLTQLRRGEPLSDAMESCGVFPSLMVSMVRSSEANGRMQEAMKDLAVHYEKAGKLKARISSATLYPKILSVLIVGIVVIIMGWVMPQFDELFAAMPTMPIATRILFVISYFVVAYWWLLGIIAVILFIVGKTLIRLDPVKLF